MNLTTSNEQTESAREARKSFYCDLCQKGYSRINEFEAHEGSYDHQHKKVRRFFSFPAFKARLVFATAFHIPSMWYS